MIEHDTAMLKLLNSNRAKILCDRLTCNFVMNPLLPRLYPMVV